MALPGKIKALVKAILIDSNGDELFTGSNPAKISSIGDTKSQTPTITAGAYSNGDAVGGKLTFADAALESGGGGVIKSFIVIDDAAQDAELELWLFDRDFTAMVDNAVFNPSAADMENFIACISTADGTYRQIQDGSRSQCDVEAAKRYDLNGTDMYGQLVTRGTPTYTGTDNLTIKVGLLQD